MSFTKQYNLRFATPNSGSQRYHVVCVTFLSALKLNKLIYKILSLPFISFPLTFYKNMDFVSV